MDERGLGLKPKQMRGSYICESTRMNYHPALLISSHITKLKLHQHGTSVNIETRMLDKTLLILHVHKKQNTSWKLFPPLLCDAHYLSINLIPIREPPCKHPPRTSFCAFFYSKLASLLLINLLSFFQNRSVWINVIVLVVCYPISFFCCGP